MQFAASVVALESLWHATSKAPPSKAEGGGTLFGSRHSDYGSGIIASYVAAKEETENNDRATRPGSRVINRPIDDV